MILLAVGLGSFFVLGVRALQANLLEQFSVQLQRGGADMFLIDIQQDQADGVRALLRDAGIGRPQLIPVLRARVTAVRGSEDNLESYADVRGRGGLGVSTHHVSRSSRAERDAARRRSSGPASRRPADAPELEVSIEKNIRDRSRIAPAT